MSCVSDTNSVYERIRLEKLTFAHRAVSVSTDPSGCNFAILQSDPKTRYTCIYYISFLEGTVTGVFCLFSIAPRPNLIEELLPCLTETLDIESCYQDNSQVEFVILVMMKYSF